MSCQTTELLPPTPIRVETALSRYPVHRLAKHGDIAIDIREKHENGEVSIKWEVTTTANSANLARLPINSIRSSSTAGLRKLAGLSRGSSSLEASATFAANSEQARARIADNIKKSLYQNASACITAKIRYKQNGGSEQNR